MIHSPDVFERDLPAQFDGVFMWDFLAGAFGPAIMPMDFDGVVEWRGYFLIFETKNPGVKPPRGQVVAFEALVVDDRFTIVFCRKRPEQIRSWTVWTRAGVTRIRGNAEALKTWCAAWFEDKRSRPRVVPVRARREREPGEEG